MVLSRTNEGAADGPRKRAKYDRSLNEVSPTIAKELRTIKASLSASNPQNVTSALYTLAQRLVVREDEHPLTLEDSRVLLAGAWSQASPGLPELFDIWARCTPREASAPISVLVRVLFLLNLDQDNRPSGSTIIKSLLLSPNIHRLTSYFGSTEKNLCFWACRLFGAVSDFNDGQFRKEIFDVFPWGHSALWPMLSMRRKDANAEGNGLTNPPDIRTTLVLLILSFIQPSTHTSIKLSLLDKGDAFSSIFRDIGKDSYALARRILDVSWEGIWGDTRIPFGTKIAAFGDQVLTSVSASRRRVELELTSKHRYQNSMADTKKKDPKANHPSLISRITFSWRCVPDLEVASALKAGGGTLETSTPAIITSLRKTTTMLIPNDDLRQQELALKILEAAPELIPGFWQTSNMTLEPRLSSRWITNIALATKIVALPSPVWSFRSTTARSASSSASPPPYVHSPPPIQAILDSILPVTLSKAALIKGLRSPSAVVRHLTASLLAHSIKKAGEIAEEMQRASEALEEDESMGSWAVGRKELLKDLSSRIPELAEVARMLDLEGGGRKAGENTEGGKIKKQKGKAKPSTIDPNRPDGATASTTAAPSTLVHEVASRLMLYYHKYLPNAVAESYVGVRNIIAPLLEGDQSQRGGTKEKQPPLRTVSQLHGLRLLEEVESYDWSVKIGTKTALYHVLHKQMTTPHAAIRNAG
ncbi:hypothetical protein FRC00_001102, partial [Tulasnella sp. 408]